MAMKRPTLSLATAVQLGAAGVLAVASVACGGVAAPVVAGCVASTAPKVSEFLQGLLTNILSGVFGDSVKGAVAEADTAHRRRQNHDLQRAITLAIAKCLRLAAAASPAGNTPPAYLTAIADTIERNPLHLEITPLDESEITTILSGNITAIRSREVLTATQWRDLLEPAAIETQSSLSLTPRIDVQAGVEFCQQHFADQLVQTLKTLGADSDPAWFAVVLRFLSEILGGVNETNSNVKKLVADNDTFRELFAAHSESMLQVIDEMRAARQERGFATADAVAVALEDIRKTMADIRGNQPSRFVLDVNNLVLRGPRAQPEWPLDPYPLLGPYAREETFAGRERDLDECEPIVTVRCRLILCLHAPSGAGKSSLLEAGLLPRLQRSGYAACLERHPGEPGLAQRLVEQLFALPPGATVADDDPSMFRRLMIRAHEQAHKPPVLLLDQIDDFLRDELTRDAALARLGPLMAATAQPVSSLRGYPCRWILCCRRDFLGEVMAWLRDVLRESRRAARIDTTDLPTDLSGLDRCDLYALPMMGEVRSEESGADVPKAAFLNAIRQPLTLRDERRRLRYPVRFEGDGDVRLAEAFARARESRPHEALVPELQVVLSHILASASTQGNDMPMRVPENVDAFIADALSRHLVRALERAFPLARDVSAMRQGRARALLALRNLAEEQKLRGRGLPESALKSILGDGAEEVLRRLSDSDTRLIVRQSRSFDGVDSYALAHDCLVQVVARAFEVGGALGDFAFDERVLELQRFVGMRADLYGRANDQAALELDDEQYDLIERHQQALVTDDSRKKWWHECRLLRTDLSYAIVWRGIPALRVHAVKRVLRRQPDRRFRDDVWWLPGDLNLGFVEIPRGQFQMGSPDHDSEAWSEELPQHHVDVGSFWIARWPVTVAQFRAFTEDAPDNDGFVLHRDLLTRGGPSDPITMVSWHDAQAYCRWLTKKLATWMGTPSNLAERLHATDRRWSVALPTEGEWEKAARGVDGRVYSWGADTLAPDKANYCDSGVGGTSPVGCFPNGAGPNGVQEMTGNVWEWTRSLWGKNAGNPDFVYPYRTDDGRENEHASDDTLRVVRGGSFLNAHVLLRTACRGRCEPRKRAFDVGFRVAISPISTT